MTELLPASSGMGAGTEHSLVGTPQVMEVFLDGKAAKAEVVDENIKSFGIFMHSLILSSNSRVNRREDHRIEVTGDESEKAITCFTLDKGFDKNLIDTIAPKVTELKAWPESSLKPSIHLINEKLRLVAKGSPSDLMKRCTYVLMDSRAVKLTRRLLREINYACRTMVAKGLGVYALAIKDFHDFSEVIKIEDITAQMTFVALVGIGKA